MPAGGSCLLGSINLDAFVKNKQFDFIEFEKAIRIAIRALNEVLLEGMPLHPLEEQQQSVFNWRQIGLGFMGLADMLIDMQVRYGSKVSLDICDTIGKFMSKVAIDESSIMAQELGSYPACNVEALLNSEYLKYNATESSMARIKKYGLFNSQLLTVPPTGSISLLIGLGAGGLEPNFANSYTRMTKSLYGEDKPYKIYTPKVEEYMKNNGLTDEDQLPEYFITSGKIPWKERVNMQAVWQSHIDASISSTVNVSNDFTVEEVEQMYIEAWRKGLKGLTMFRDGCARLGILTTDKPKAEETPKKEKALDSVEFNSIKPISRKSLGTTSGKTYCKKCACGTLYITINTDENGNIVETFVHTSKGGVCQANLNGLNRMISTCLRSGVKVEEIYDQLLAINCPACATLKGKGTALDGMSCPDIVGRTLRDFYKDNKPIKNTIVQAEEKVEQTETNHDHCPECGAIVNHEGGCVTCTNCGWSKCG